ncbi:MAG TPA: YiiX/YebB-like N1pC/P60 family cysteine hydrolase [Bacteroidales bacterium]|jgi:hypothetical protein|nr:YiiX/YebB-like N1pC/P60 family cysteine hydrolase [Bacteroidales bacterium]
MTLNKKFIIVIIICLTLAAIILFIHFYESKSKQQEQINDYALQAQEIAMLKEGDLMFRKGFGIISDCIARASKERFCVSHVGVLYNDTNKGWMVIHTVSNTLVDIDGMQMDKLDKFVKDSHPNSIVVLRYRYANDSSQTAFALQAYYYLQRKIPFDDAFNINDTSEFYCTEFIRQLFLDVYHTDIYKLNSSKPYSSMRFTPFWNETNFQLVFTHQ